METPSKSIPAQLDRMFEQFRSYLYERAGIYYPDSSGRAFSSTWGPHAGRGQARPRRLPRTAAGRAGASAASWRNCSARSRSTRRISFASKPSSTSLRDRVLPQLFQKKKAEGRDRVTIWSAASSSGEEAYSLAILLKESFPGELTTTAIIGFRPEPQVVEKGRQGRIRRLQRPDVRREANVPPISKAGATYSLVPYIKRLASFQLGNLMELQSLRTLRRPDLILCRNVLIYFDRESKAQALKNLAACLLPHGYLSSA